MQLQGDSGRHISVEEQTASHGGQPTRLRRDTSQRLPPTFGRTPRYSHSRYFRFSIVRRISSAVSGLGPKERLPSWRELDEDADGCRDGSGRDKEEVEP